MPIMHQAKIPRRTLLLCMPIFCNYLGGIVTGKPGDAATRVCARAADIEIFNRSLVRGPAGNRAHEEDLIQRHFGMIGMALRQFIGLFEIKRREHLPIEDRL